MKDEVRSVKGVVEGWSGGLSGKLYFGGLRGEPSASGRAKLV